MNSPGDPSVRRDTSPLAGAQGPPATPGVRRAAEAVAAMLSGGIEQGEAVLAYMRTTHGGDSPEDFRAVLNEPDGPDARSLCALLLSPGENQLAGLEPGLEAAACSPEEALEVSRQMERAFDTAWAVLPGGERIALPLEPGDVAAMVSRLRLDSNPPAPASRVLGERYPPELAARIKSELRHSRIAWTDQRAFFLAALLGALDPALPGLEDVLAWTLVWLGSLPPDSVPAQRLGVKHGELTARLRRSQDFHAALSKSSFELMMAQGARVSLPHPDEVRRELGLLDTVCRAVTGRPCWALEGMTEVDLGQVEDEESLMRALGGP